MLELGPEGWRTVRPRAWRLVLWCGMIAICSTNIYWGSFKKIKKHKGTHKAISEKCHKFAWMKDYRNWCKEGTDFSCKRIRRTLESSYFRAGKRGKKQSLSIARVRHCVRCFMDPGGWKGLSRWRGCLSKGQRRKLQGSSKGRWAVWVE